ncbi:unnamed protein product [Acanthoscelides obtectus]|uniref:Uncharacterized protein n=1 Tax=Acanthoscelides obtectus TaxID=200917 RepID=A0A9P0MEM9_ACAOB|nr:unnamed protein product [Acanthoscelides obtectus]CAK1641057.1 hypothetical protein AOBTE_LOCUS12115 [Acanthoscelides obtectus]
MNTKIIPHGEQGKLLGNTRNLVETVKMLKMECDCFPKLFSDMEDADYYIQAAKRLQKKNNGYKLKIIVIPWYSCVMCVISNKHDNR